MKKEDRRFRVCGNKGECRETGTTGTRQGKRRFSAIIGVLCCAAILLALSGCAANEENDSEPTPNATETPTITVIPTPTTIITPTLTATPKVTATPKITATATPRTTDAPTPNNANESGSRNKTNTPTPITAEVGKTYIIKDQYELTIDGVGLGKEIGLKYNGSPVNGLVLAVTFKNLLPRTVILDTDGTHKNHSEDYIISYGPYYKVCSVLGVEATRVDNSREYGVHVGTEYNEKALDIEVDQLCTEQLFIYSKGDYNKLDSVCIKLKIEDQVFQVEVSKNGTKTVDPFAATDKQKIASKSGEVTKNEIVTESSCQFLVEYAEIADTIFPPNADLESVGVYSNRDGFTIVNICFAYKNISKEPQQAKKIINAKLVYNDKYEYSCGLIAGDSDQERSAFDTELNYNIVENGTEHIYCMFEVPKEVATSGESIVIFFKINGNSYTYKVN